MKYDRARIEYLARVYGLHRGTDREAADALIALLHRVDELEAALRRYGSHLGSCRRYRLVDAEAEDGETFYDPSRPCTCGYSKSVTPITAPPKPRE